MAFSEALAERVRGVIGDHPAVVEKRMFGGLAFLLQGNMAVGVHGPDLIVRVGEEGHDDALARPATRVFDLTGRPMRGWVLVAPSGLGDDTDLESWVEAGLAYAAGLPGK